MRPSRYGGPADPHLRHDWQRARRSLALAHHPDRGGEPGALDEELRELDAYYARLEHRAVPGTHAVRPSGPRRRAMRALAKWLRTLRSHLPRRMPGSRRYTDL